MDNGRCVLEEECKKKEEGGCIIWMGRGVCVCNSSCLMASALAVWLCFSWEAVVVASGFWISKGAKKGRGRLYRHVGLAGLGLVEEKRYTMSVVTSSRNLGRRTKTLHLVFIFVCIYMQIMRRGECRIRIDRHL